MEFHGGRLPPTPDKPRLRLSKYLKAVKPAPPTVDYLSKVQSWPMYLNDKLGDCTCAGAAHIIENESTYGQGATITVTDDDVLTAYEAVSGYDPSTGKNDNGAVMQQVLTYWRKTGVGKHKILAFAGVDHRNVDQLHAALATFGSLYIGINFPESAMTQFNEHKPWDVVPGARIEGGHAINAGFYDTDAKTWKIVTWGAVQEMTQAFWDTYVEEAWVVIAPEWLNTAGTSPEGLDLYALGEDFAELTGESNPFPAPTPGPEPVPAPPRVDVADQHLALTVQPWLASDPSFYDDLQEALRTWLAAKGLPTTESTT